MWELAVSWDDMISYEASKNNLIEFYHCMLNVGNSTVFAVSPKPY